MADTERTPMSPGQKPGSDPDDIDDLLDSLTSNGHAARRAVTTGTLTEPAPLSTGGLLVGGLVGLAIAAIIGSLVLSWLALSRSSDEAVDSTAAAAGPGAPDDGLAAQVSGVLQSVGLTNVLVEERNDVVYLSGSVATEAERRQAIETTEALSDGKSVDASALVALDNGTPPADQAASGTEEATGGDERQAAYQAEIDRLIATTPIIFGVGQSQLTDQQRRILDTLATTMKAYPEYKVTVVGYTDGRGADADNEALSAQRANNVKDHLVAQGIDGNSLDVDARGEETSTGAETLAGLERRVEFEVGTATGQPAAAADGALRIGVIAPSARDDLAFTQSMVDAVQVISEERGEVQIEITDGTFVPAEAEAAIRGYADGGYDVIIAHGSQYGPSVFELAQEYPEVAFGWGTASDTFGLPNVYAYDVAAEQGGYVIGAMAASLSTSGIVGFIGPIEVGDAQRYANGYRAGARAERSARVEVVWTDSFSDATLAAEAAEQHRAAGADVMTGTAQMVVGAVSVARENNMLWFGNQANQSTLAPELVVASQVYRWEVVLRELVADIDAGTLTGQTFTADFANGGLVIEYNPDYPLDPAVRARADQLVADISSGAIQVPNG